MMSNIKNIPKRRFSNFEDEWEEKKLEELSNIVRGASPRPIQDPKWFDEKSEIGWLRISDVSEQDGRIYKLEQRLSELGQQKTRVVHEPHLLMSIAATVGKPVINYIKTGVHDGFLIFLEPKFNLEFMFKWLEMYKNQWKRYGQPGSQLNLNSDIVKNQTIILPECNEQVAIGSFFQLLDQSITLHQHKLDKLKNLKKAYLAELFPAEGQRVPKRRFLGFEGEWEEKKLGEITTYRNGTGHEEKQSRFGKYELVNLNSISIDGGLKPSGRFIEEASETLMKNDLVMVLSDVAHGDLLGRVAVIPENDKFVLNQRVALLRHNGIVDIKYLFSFINAHQKYFKLQGAGSSQLNLSRDSVENFEVALPSVEEQKTIGNFLEKLDKSISLQQQKLDKLKDLKKAYLNELFV